MRGSLRLGLSWLTASVVSHAGKPRAILEVVDDSIVSGQFMYTCMPITVQHEVPLDLVDGDEEAAHVHRGATVGTIHEQLEPACP